MSDNAVPPAAGTLRRPVVWSLSSNDSAGGAGLSADARLAEAFDVHLCPVITCLTAQNSRAVEHLMPVRPAQLEAQLEALVEDLPPDAIKTGLLGDAALVEVIARWVDALRRRKPDLALVVDPVLRASTGAIYADAPLLAAYQELLLPRATVVMPDRAIAQALLEDPDSSVLPVQPDMVGPRDAVRAAPITLPSRAPSREQLPALARALRERGAAAVCITQGDGADLGHPGHTLDWMDAPEARGWLVLARPTPAHCRGRGAGHATAVAAALARGFVIADALVLGRMAISAAIAAGRAAGGGAGPIAAPHGFVDDPALLPWLGWGDELPAALVAPPAVRAPALRPGLYGLVDDVAHLGRARGAAGPALSALQLRLKPDGAPKLDAAAFAQRVQAQVDDAVAQLAAGEAGTVPTLVVNDHWQAAVAARARAPALPMAVHLGQEDLAALGTSGRAELRRGLAGAAGRAPIALGVSSHSLWELARAAGLGADYIACGPVWPTRTKDMPWRPQGLDNLAWWCRMAPAPVVAIGGVLEAAQVEACAAAGAHAVCLVRALQATGAGPATDWSAAWTAGRTRAPTDRPLAGWPHPSLARPVMGEAAVPAIALA